MVRGVAAAGAARKLSKIQMSSSKASATASAGIGLPSLLTAIFAAAKVFGFVSWSWWIVFLPALISTGIGLSLLAVVVVLLIIAAFANK